MTGPLSVDLNEDFPSLAKPPIVEAMISFVSRARSVWTPEAVGKRIMDALPDYPNAQHMNHARFSFAMQAGEQAMQPPAPGAAHAVAENLGWMGLRLISADGRRVATPTVDGLSLSWLGDYAGWTELSTEMLRLWKIHKAISGADAIERIEIRYVNRLELPGVEFDPSEYFQGFGTAPPGMVRGPFLHQDTLGHPAFMRHMVNLVRTFEPPAPNSPTSPLLLVLEASNADPMPAEDAIISQRLAELHWLKNYAFFQSVTQAYLDLCK